MPLRLLERTSEIPVENVPRALLALSLELEKRPILLMDAQKRVLAANSHMTSLMKCSLESLAGSGVETHLAPDNLVPFRKAFDTALPGIDRRFECNFIPAHGPMIAATTRLSAATLSDSEQPAYFLTIMEIRNEVETPALANGISYLISSANLTFGQLKEIWGVIPGRPREKVLGNRCFEAFFGRKEACAGCPVFSKTLGETPSSCVLAGTRDGCGPLEVVSARATSETQVVVTRWPVDQDLLSSLVASKIDSIIAKAQLTPQEGEVLRFLFLGRSTSEIAKELGIVPRTAKYHQRKVLRKIGAESRLDVSRLLL